jgi:hypothetical protein
MEMEERDMERREGEGEIKREERGIDREGRYK